MIRNDLDIGVVHQIYTSSKPTSRICGVFNTETGIANILGEVEYNESRGPLQYVAIGQLHTTGQWLSMTHITREEIAPNREEEKYLKDIDRNLNRFYRMANDSFGANGVLGIVVSFITLKFSAATGIGALPKWPPEPLIQRALGPS